MITGMLRIRPQVSPPARLAHLPRFLLWAVDAAPCPCGQLFGRHDWVLTVPDEITVLTCSRQDIDD